jgi:DNA-binding CsgD family transcriptional regulator
MTMDARRMREPREPDVERPSSSQPSVVTFRQGEAQFAVLSVPLDGEDVLGDLSRAEREVAKLAAAGLTNAAIAMRRGTAVRTVANQMASILLKLRAGSRYEVAARLALCSLDVGEP